MIKAKTYNPSNNKANKIQENTKKNQSNRQLKMNSQYMKSVKKTNPNYTDKTHLNSIAKIQDNSIEKTPHSF